MKKREKYATLADILDDPKAKFRARFTDESICKKTYIGCTLLNLPKQLVDEYDFIAILSDYTGNWDHVFEGTATIYGGKGNPDDRKSRVTYLITY